MKRHCGLVLGACLALSGCQTTKKEHSDRRAPETSAALLSDARQFTFGGTRSGEGYFSADGRHFIFQSEREEGNPFYQIYLQDLEANKVHRVSPGHGKTTCAWIHPKQKKVMFSSTHLDPETRNKQKAELDFRASGQTKRYSWDYDENYDIFETNWQGKQARNLTKVKGYDAEGSYSPDGRYIVFSSNRHAYTEQLSDEDQKLLSQDPSLFLDLYIMNADGTGVKRLTDHRGYDGGPFFSPDGKRIVWRRFAADGHTAEIFTMNADGTDVQQVTRMKAMSWAPFYHPGGDYIIFTSNIFGYENFELFIVDSSGKRNPVRVSQMPGFDGLPVFHPNGQELYWSRSTDGGGAQIFFAKWDDAGARRALGLPPAAPAVMQLAADVREGDVRSWVEYFASPEMKGRDTGSDEERRYGEQIEKAFIALGIRPAGDKGGYFQTFSFDKGLKLGAQNSLTIEGEHTPAILNKDYRPLSGKGPVPSSDVVWAGYGLVAPAQEKQRAYDSYTGLDVNGKWVMVLRYLPEDLKGDERTHLQRYAQLPFKVSSARSRGAKGLIIVSGPQSGVKEQLVPLASGQALGAPDFPVVSITDQLAQKILNASSVKLGHLQAELDKGKAPSVNSLKGVRLSAHVELTSESGSANNILGLLAVPGAKHTVVIGAHGDHLGVGKNESSLMTKDDKSEIHLGADDNASGMAGVMELAHFFSQEPQRKRLKKNLLFVIWSGEERGTLGSQHFTRELAGIQKSRRWAPAVAYVNMDMIGRFRDKLSIQGTASASNWPQFMEKIGNKAPVAFNLQGDPYLPTDAMPLYMAGVPVLAFFTGAHTEYHTPRDTSDSLNYPGTEKVIQTVALAVQELAQTDFIPRYSKVTQDPKASGARRGFRIFLGTVPDYSQTGAKGVRLSGVVSGGPADQAGVKKGDVIVAFGGQKIETIYDYVYALQSLKPNEKTTLSVLRDGRTQDLEVVPVSKE